MLKATLTNVTITAAATVNLDQSLNVNITLNTTNSSGAQVTLATGQSFYLNATQAAPLLNAQATAAEAAQNLSPLDLIGQRALIALEATGVYVTPGLIPTAATTTSAAPAA